MYRILVFEDIYDTFSSLKGRYKMKDYGRCIEEVYDFVSLNFADMAYISLNQSTYDLVK